MDKENCGNSLTSFDRFKCEILAELKRVKNKDLEDMVCRKQLTYDEILDVFHVKHFDGSTIGNTLPHGIYEIFGS